MSRAFVKEPESGAPGEPLPPRRISEHPNFVTPRGLAQLRQRGAELARRRAALLLAPGASADVEDELRHVERELAYFTARAASAIVVDAGLQPPDAVAFGASVTVREQAAGAPPSLRAFTIVGEDEADADAGLVSHVSPLAKALDGARVGQTVVWRRPIGDVTLTVVHIAYAV
jgi:transcription elongation GreA/GreB family factor